MHKELPQGVTPPEEELEAKEPTRDEKVEARVAALTETFTRRALEGIARELGFEPTRTEYPNKESLATAIAEKEIPEEATEEVTEEAPVEEEAEPA